MENFLNWLNEYSALIQAGATLDGDLSGAELVENGIRMVIAHNGSMR